jgi:hypothetical protein
MGYRGKFQIPLAKHFSNSFRFVKFQKLSKNKRTIPYLKNIGIIGRQKKTG